MTWALAPTVADIQALSDEALRELLNRCCTAELVIAGRSVAAIWAGGHQNASDDGLDLYLDDLGGPLPFLPAFPLGIQAKATSMPRQKIIDEMRPEGVARPVFGRLAARKGGYIIACSRDSVAYKQMQVRETVMADTLADVPDRADLTLAFYDAEHLARWAGTHPGVSLWVGEQVGRPRPGWRAFGPWSAPNRPSEPYLPDRDARVLLGDDGDRATPGEAIADLRARLAAPGALVRLVGLSGTGKTRFAQALFEQADTNMPSLDPCLAAYCDVGIPSPISPETVVAELAAARVRAALVVDNCNAVTHRRLADLAKADGSQLSLLTIDFDVADDQPEETFVVLLESASHDTVENLLRLRFPNIGGLSRAKIAEFAEGNTRVALAVAGASRGVAVHKLRDADLRDRLFLVGRRDPDETLRWVARAISLFGAIDIEAEAEIAVVCILANVDDHTFHAKLHDLLERGLAQQRGKQRAVLPQAVAAWLAEEALDKLDPRLLWKTVVEEGPRRLLKSFLNRLGSLEDSARARDIAAELLAPGGRAVPPDMGHDERWDYLISLAPLAEDRVIEILEGFLPGARPDDVSYRYIFRDRASRLLLALAFNDERFDVAFELLTRVILPLPGDGRDTMFRKSALCLFQVERSFTMATPARRFAAIERLAASGEPERVTLAHDALVSALSLSLQHPSSLPRFGSRLPDVGWRPQTPDETLAWFRNALALADRLLAAPDGEALKAKLAQPLSQMVGKELFEPLGLAAMRRVAGGRFWRDGWFALCGRLHWLARGGKSSPAKGHALEVEMRPLTLEDRYQAWVRGDVSAWQDPARPGRRAERDMFVHTDALGAECAGEPAKYAAIVPRAIVDGAANPWALGAGLGKAITDLDAAWAELVATAVAAPAGTVRPLLFNGFLHEAHKRGANEMEAWLETALSTPSLRRWTVQLNAAASAPGEAAGRRFLEVLRSGDQPLEEFRHVGRIEDLPSATLDEIVREIMTRPGGVAIACEMVAQRCFMANKRPLDELTLTLGRDVLATAADEDDFNLRENDAPEVARACLVGAGGAAAAKRIGAKLGEAFRRDAGSPWTENLPAIILSRYPTIGLDAFLTGKRAPVIHPLDLVLSGGDDEDHSGLSPERPLGPQAAGEIEAWVRRSPPARAPRVARYVVLFKADGDRTVWTPLALWLLEQAPRAVGEVYVERFIRGGINGSEMVHFQRRLTLVEGLRSHADAAVAGWAQEAAQRLRRSIKAVRDAEAGFNGRFE